MDPGAGRIRVVQDERGTLGIGAVARRTGLSADVIRVWERRYHAVEPDRSDGGTRLYSENNVRRLEMLARLVGRGHRIGRLAKLEEEALAALLHGSEEENGSQADASESAAAASRSAGDLGSERALDGVVQDAVEATLALDTAKLESVLSNPFFVLGPRGFILQVALPLLWRIGDLWEAGELSVASEHAAVGVLRTLLGAALRQNRPPPGAPRFVFATPSGQRHEFGALAAAVLAAEQGIDALYLGADLPAEDLAAAIRDSGATRAVLGLSAADSDHARGFVETVRRHLPADVVLCVGGSTGDAIARELGVVGFSTLDGFEASLVAEDRGAAGGGIGEDHPRAGA